MVFWISRYGRWIKRYGRWIPRYGRQILRFCRWIRWLLGMMLSLDIQHTPQPNIPYQHQPKPSQSLGVAQNTHLNLPHQSTPWGRLLHTNLTNNPHLQPWGQKNYKRRHLQRHTPNLENITPAPLRSALYLLRPTCKKDTPPVIVTTTMTGRQATHMPHVQIRLTPQHNHTHRTMPAL